MPDYIYLLENRLSADQQSALQIIRKAASEAGIVQFLTGDAVRDLTSGHSVRDLEVSLQGNALKLKKTIEKLGGKVWGEDEATRTISFCFPGTVRVNLVSTHSVEYPKPGKTVYQPASIQEDLRRRDFTANAMAISLNEGSFGLLMDPMNGAADIESRTLRLVSNYGFLEEPSLLIRATRYGARLGWEMDPKTHTRYLNAKEEGVIEHLSALARRSELEQIGYEEEGLQVLRALEAEGWMAVLFPSWSSDKADEKGLAALHDLAVELLLQGVHADMSAAQMRLLTAGLARKELSALKKQMLRPGFVDEWNSLDAQAAGFAKALSAKECATPSACFKLFMSYDPEAILWLGFISKDATVKERFNLFLKVWPEVRQSIPYALMQEMRITAELPAYNEIVQNVFLQLIDGKLSTPEEARAFLEPYSPPTPPPQVVVKRPRAKRSSEAKLKGDSFEEESEEPLEEEEETLEEIGGGEDALDLELTPLPKDELDVELGEGAEAAVGEEEEEEEENRKPATRPGKTEKSQPFAKLKTPPRPEHQPEAAKMAKPASSVAKPSAPAAHPKAKPAPAKKAEAKPAAKKTPAKPQAKTQPKIAAKQPVNAKAKAAAKPPVKGKATKVAPARKKSANAPSLKKAKAAASGKPAAKPAKKH